MYKSALVALAVASLLSGTAFAQTAASSYTTGYRYDAMRRLTGVIQPDPDGTGALKFAAERYTYDADGVLLKKEIGELAGWQSQAVAPASWTGFTLLQSVEYAYDAAGRKLSERVKGANDTTYSLTQFSYDAAGRLSCTALRMNESAFSTPPSDACALGTSGSQGADRISKNIYDAAGQVVQLRQAVGTPLEQSYATYSFTPNGKREYVVDANGNRSKFEYDSFDRQKKWIFPSSSKPAAFNPASPTVALASAGAINTADYEEYGYDANGNRTSLRKRDTSILSYQYDALNRMTLKTVPERTGLPSVHTRDVHYSYSLTGSQTSARFDNTAGAGIISTYDGFGRVATETNTLIGAGPVLAYQYDRNGNRTRITHNGSQSFDMTFDGLNRLKEVKRGATILASASYTNRGGVAAIDRYNAALDQGFTYDSVGRLQSLNLQQGTNSSNASWTFTRNAASQIRTEVRTNDAYAWDERVDSNTGYVANGLNQYSQIGTVDFCYDANGNLTADGENAYLYDIENRLVEMRMRISTAVCPTAQSGYSGSLLGALQYDPMGRLHEVKSYSNDALAGVTRFVYDGNALVMSYDGNNALIDRYIHGSDGEADDPLIWYAGSGTADNAIRNLYADARGSIVLVADQGGAALGTNTYDEWGSPDPDNVGRFQFTGQVWLPEIGMYYYKARVYSPRLGRFMQTDPIGYEDQINLYAYVASDPLNNIDPTGTSCVQNESGADVCTIDDTKSFLDAGYSRSEIKQLAQNYANAVGQARRFGDQEVELIVGDRKFTTTGTEIAEGLSNAYVQFDPKTDGIATMAGGPRTNGNTFRELSLRDNPKDLPFVLSVSSKMFHAYGEGGDTLNVQQSKTFLHEGIHTARGEVVTKGMRGFQAKHDGPYDATASRIWKSR